MSIPYISIIVPVYNVEKYLKRCIDSLLNQTLKNIEIILVDDESPDNCPKICNEYKTIDSRIKVIHKKNEGLGFARNSGIEIATGEFIAFVDSDDTIHPQMYEDLYNTTRKYNLDAAYCSINRMLDEHTIIKFKETDELKIFVAENICKDFMANMIAPMPEFHSDVKYHMSSCRAIYSLQLIKCNDIKFGSERKVLSEDILFNIDYLKKSTGVALIPKYYYNYWKNEGSLTNSYVKNRMLKSENLYNIIKEKLIDSHLYQECYLNLNRLFLFMTRIALVNEIIFNKNNKKKKSNIKLICNHPILEKILKDYPYKKLPIKHRLFFLLLKFKMYFAIRIILKIQEYIK